MVRHHTLGNYGEADLSPVRSWVLDRVGHQPTSWARAFANFRELRKGEVQHSPGPDGPGPPAAEWPSEGYHVSYVHHANLYIRITLRHGTRAKRRAGAVCCGELRPHDRSRWAMHVGKPLQARLLCPPHRG